MNRLVHVAVARGERARGVELYEECLALARPLGNERLVAAMLYNLSQQSLAAGDLVRASEQARESILIYQATARDVGIAACLATFAALAAAGGDGRAAVQLFAAADAANPHHAESFDQLERLTDHTGTIESLRAAPGAEEFAAAWVEGRALSHDDAIALAFGADLDPAAQSVTDTAE